MPPPSATSEQRHPVLAGFSDHLAQILTGRGKRLSPHTVRAYVSRVAGYLDWLDACDPEQWHGDPLRKHGSAQLAVDDYRSHLLTVQKRSIETVNAHLTAVSTFYLWRGLSRIVHPSARIDVPDRAPEALDSDDVKRLLDFVDTRANDPEKGPETRLDQALIYVAYFAGLRVDELAALDVEDVPLTARGGQVIVRQGKGGKPRSVPVAPELRPVLERWRGRRLYAHGENSGPVPLFLGERGRLGTSGIRRRVAAVGKRIKLDLHPHQLRHSFGKKLADQGIPLRRVAELMGHSRTETTNKYTAPTEQDLADDVEALSVRDVAPRPRDEEKEER